MPGFLILSLRDDMTTKGQWNDDDMPVTRSEDRMMKGPHQGMQGFQKAVLWKALFFLLAGILPPGAAAAQLIDPPGDADPAKTWEALLDSLRSEPDSLIPWNESAPEEWVKPGEIAWIPDASDSTTAKGRDGASTLSFDIQPVFGFSKVDGATPGFKLSLSTKKEPDIHLCGVLRRGLEAGRWEGFGLAGGRLQRRKCQGIVKESGNKIDRRRAGRPGESAGRLPGAAAKSRVGIHNRVE
ncbi:MAG: hypothetical protein KJ831_03415 [Candidatus Eisenbacteria bacterium]|nr:hypothetical protein [Candidatus Eisenbacteria bacterium]